MICFIRQKIGTNEEDHHGKRRVQKCLWLEIKNPHLPICVGKRGFQTPFHHSKNESDVFIILVKNEAILPISAL
jgi:hypothetical protein